MGEKISVLYHLEEGAKKPTQGYKGDFASDLYANRSELLIPHMFSSTLVDTGVRTRFDENRAGMFISLRSGAASKLPLMVSNSPGIVEGTYQNTIGVLLRNTFSYPHMTWVDYVLHLTKDGITHVPVEDVDKETLHRAKEQYKANTELFGQSFFSSMPKDVREQMEYAVFHTKAPKGTVLVQQGDRIAQASFIPKMEPSWSEHPNYFDEKTERGENGKGSSGTN